jgi:hypothetical protein
MARYRWDKERRELVEISDAGPQASAGPALHRDYEGYRSPVNGQWIEGRAARREDLKRTGCIDAREKFGGDGRHPKFREQREAARSKGLI